MGYIPFRELLNTMRRSINHLKMQSPCRLRSELVRRLRHFLLQEPTASHPFSAGVGCICGLPGEVHGSETVKRKLNLVDFTITVMLLLW